MQIIKVLSLLVMISLYGCSNTSDPAAIIFDTEVETEAPQQIIHNVPFVSQAPFGDWDDQRQQDGCEEASLLMAYKWAKGATLSKEEALKTIIELSEYQLENNGYYNDTSAADTAVLMIDYFHYDAIEVLNDESVTTERIKQELALGNIIIAPVQGQRLGNPNFSGNGPERHKLVIKGYDDIKQHFITNDPGTRKGEDYRYDYAVLMSAIMDYPSGYKVPIQNERKAVIIVKPDLNSQ